MAAHSNAYFYGFGQTKVIVLHDTLLTKLNPKEITSVVCHEMGHWAYSHPFKKLFVYLVEVWSIFYIFSFFLQNEEVFLSFGFREKSVLFLLKLEFHRFRDGIPLVRATYFSLHDLIISTEQEILVRGRYVCLSKWVWRIAQKFTDKIIRGQH